NSAWVDSVSPTTKNISIDYNITSKLNTEATVHTIILENVTYKNKRTNGETEFHHVVMGMFPDGNGSTTLFKKDSTYNFSFVYNMAASNIEEFNDLKLVVFIQNYATKEIYGNAQRDVSARVQTATPIINPAIGNFSDSVFVTISAATYGATIYYTVDGSVPTSASTLYSGGFYIKDEKTVKAIAVKSDYLDSEVSSVTYTKAVATPVINPSDSVFPDSVFVTISTPTSGADIYYTIDGSTPTSSSLLYSGGFYVSTTTTVKAIATKSGEKNSDIAIALYTKRQVATPEIEPYRIELFMDSLLITISTATPDAEIYYTVDGSAPTTSSLLYGGSGFYINSTKTIKAIGVKEGFDNSGIVVATYSKSKVNIPVINPSERNFIDSLLITISTTTPDAEIYYTVDGSAPTTSSFLYDSSGFYINSTKTIKAIGVKGGYENSDVVSATFTKSPSSANENLSNAISVKVYPNPVTDFITVESPANSTLLLYNSVGVLVYQGVGGNRKLPVASMPSGVYTLKVVSDKGVATQKIVKK
ncbi:MAG: chitobiase/beta-hexosaminidase C-terminal domain-containing protein, partial [Bacteroidales bacterium]|nr:chitobiase/beta-hexosaminidase C-terminal domain-containing protein [Bacteroidales bacterium]